MDNGGRQTHKSASTSGARQTERGETIIYCKDFSYYHATNILTGSLSIVKALCIIMLSTRSLSFERFTNIHSLSHAHAFIVFSHTQRHAHIHTRARETSLTIRRKVNWSLGYVPTEEQMEPCIDMRTRPSRDGKTYLGNSKPV